MSPERIMLEFVNQVRVLNIGKVTLEVGSNAHGSMLVMADGTPPSWSHVFIVSVTQTPHHKNHTEALGGATTTEEEFTSGVGFLGPRKRP